MAELLNVADLEAAKKHDTFHSEAITGKVNGSAIGADIDTATNAVTGQVQNTLPFILDSIETIALARSKASTPLLLTAGQSSVTVTGFNGSLSAYYVVAPVGSDVPAYRLFKDVHYTVANTTTETITLLQTYPAGYFIAAVSLDPTGTGIISSDQTFNGVASGLVFNTLSDAINLNLGTGRSLDAAKLALFKTTITTRFNHINTSSGGGAKYSILTAAEYGSTPDGVVIGGIITGADHYIGGGTSYVLKLEPINGQYWAEMFGLSVDGTLSNSTSIFNNAFSYLNGKTLHLPEKRLKYSGEVTVPSLSIVGVRPPIKSADNTKLEYGSIIEGSLIIRSPRLHATKFGVDHGVGAFPTAQQNAFVASPDVANEGVSAYVEDIVGLGRDAQDPFHAVLVEGYRRTYAHRLYGYKTYFGVVIKTFDSVVGDLIGEHNGLYNVIVKADLTQSVTKNLSIGNVVGIGELGVTGVNFEVEAIGEQLQNVNIASISGTDANSVFRFVSDDLDNAIINTVNIGSVVGSNSQAEAIRTVGTIVSLIIDKVNLQNCKHKAADFEKVNHLIINSLVASASAGNTYYDNNFVTIGANCGATQLSQISLLDQFGAVGSGMINYLNPRGRNKLAMYNAKVKGVGAPVTQTSALNSIAMASPIATYKVSRVEIASNTSALPLKLTSLNVEDGHVVVIDNLSGVSTSITNNDGITILSMPNGTEATLINQNGLYAVMARR